MPAGLEVYDASGRLIISVTSRLAKLSGVVRTTPNQGGSLNIPGDGQAYYMTRDGSDGGMFSNVTYPPITLNGRTLSWGASGRSITIVYGAF